jgi:hypothetical protein
MIRSEKIIWIFFCRGLRAPRNQFIQDNQVICPTVTKEEFTRGARDLVSTDNQSLTYLAARGILLAKLVGLAFKPPHGLFSHPLVLLFPLIVGLVHFQFFSGLLFPQSCWFFLLLLGRIILRGVYPATAGLRARGDLSYVPNIPMG